MEDCYSICSELYIWQCGFLLSFFLSHTLKAYNGETAKTPSIDQSRLSIKGGIAGISMSGSQSGLQRTGGGRGRCKLCSLYKISQF